jgi:nicotinate dehydrogenase subunit B
MNPLVLASLRQNPRPERWLGFDAQARLAVVRTGKVELGQGVLTALAQLAADALGLPLARVRLVSGDTAGGPDEGWTAGSTSLEQSGGALAVVCGLARSALAQTAPGSDYWTHAAQVLERTAVLLRQWLQDPAGTPLPGPGTHVGGPVPRVDSRSRVLGGGFIQDLSFAGLLHARVLRPPRPLARARSWDLQALEAVRGVQHVVADGSFLAVAGEDEGALVRALPLAHRHVRWESPALPVTADLLGGTQDSAPEDDDGVVVRLERGFLTSASIGTSTGIAVWQDGGPVRLEVWSHSQGVFALRRQLAAAHGLAEAEVVVRHVPHAGCYGHNGADDAAFEATLVARARPGRAVRLVWTRAEELAWSPMGSAMRVEVRACLGHDGRVRDWHASIRSGTHANRPGWGDGIRFAAGALLSRPLPSGTLDDIPEPMGWGGQRNAWPYYIPDAARIDYTLVPMPVRTSSLRSLGAHVNVAAIEGVMDELAARAGEDPLAFRLRHLQDGRARAVLERVAAMSDWPRRNEQPYAFGLAFARYKNKAAYMAAVVAVDLSQDVRVRQVWAAVDCGLAVNPDGVRNQVEGGIVQALSWTLHEEVGWDAESCTTADWETYRILRFDEAPRIEVDLLAGGPEILGVGEVACGPTAAALSNALAAGLGTRLTRMPYTRERIIQALA